MSDLQVRELFASTRLEPAADRLDVDAAIRVGRRRRRVRFAATGASAVAVVVAAGAFAASSLTAPAPDLVAPSTTSAAPAPSSPAPTGAGTTSFGGTSAQEWAESFEQDLPTGTQLPAVRVYSAGGDLPQAYVAHAIYRYTDDQGRTTALSVNAATEGELEPGQTAWQLLQSSCGTNGLRCEVTSRGGQLVLIRRNSLEGSVSASYVPLILSDSALTPVVVTVSSFDRDTDAHHLIGDPVPGGPGLDADALADLVLRIPVPALGYPSP